MASRSTVEPQETETLEVNLYISLQSIRRSNLWRGATFGEGTR